MLYACNFWTTCRCHPSCLSAGQSGFVKGFCSVRCDTRSNSGSMRCTCVGGMDERHGHMPYNAETETTCHGGCHRNYHSAIWSGLVQVSACVHPATSRSNGSLHCAFVSGMGGGHAQMPYTCLNRSCLVDITAAVTLLFDHAWCRSSPACILLLQATKAACTARLWVGWAGDMLKCLTRAYPETAWWTPPQLSLCYLIRPGAGLHLHAPCYFKQRGQLALCVCERDGRETRSSASRVLKRKLLGGCHRSCRSAICPALHPLAWSRTGTLLCHVRRWFESKGQERFHMLSALARHRAIEWWNS